MSARTVEVPRPRLSRWAGGFLDRHGAGQWRRAGEDVVLEGADGATAHLVADRPGALDGVTSVRSLVGRPAEATVAVVLVRRGGYAVGVARGGELLDSKCGTRYVQSRTAAGGWSQQRYARRRSNQADALAQAAADAVAARIVHRADIQALVVGGDRLLVAHVLSDPRLSTLAGLPRRELDAVREPRRAVLEDCARRADTVRIIVTDPKEKTVPTSRELLPAAALAARKVADAVPATAWERPSPCEGWSARDVLNHLTSEHLWAPHLLAGETLEQVGDRYDGDVLGEDPAGAFGSAVEGSMAAFADPAVESVHTSMGELPVKEYAQQMLVDLTVHGWDLSRATAVAFDADPESVIAAHRYELPRVESTGVEGIFAAPVSTSSNNRLDQLVALTGRDPNWVPRG